MALSSDQQHVLSTILRIGRQRGAGPKQIKAAIETGLVESDLHNLPGGSGDSAGWRQERASLYPDPTNLTASVNRFFDETGALSGKYGRAGDLAAAVQRPREDLRGKYQERSGDADTLMAQLGVGRAASHGNRGGLASALTGSVTPGQVTGGGFDPGTPDVSSLADLLGSSRPQPVAPQLPAAPFSSSKYLHMGNSPVVAQSQPEASGSGIDSLLAAMQGSGQEIPQTSVSAAQTSVSGSAPTAHASSAGGSSRGRVIVPDGANRPGVGLTPGIMRVIETVAGRIGHPITIGTGTRHNRLTVDGNVSDHWDGNAADIPTTPGDQNIRLGRNALIALGVPRAQAMKADGGIYNIPYGKHRRIQVIFNTNEGGDHHNHVHLGVSALGR